jgi:hypothetical protein
MDSWSPVQIELMRQGGNGQIREFYKKLQLENSPIPILYSTKGANHYRERLRERAEKIISGEITPERRRSFKSEKTNDNGHDLNKKSSPRKEGYQTADFLTVSFCEGTMGLTLTKDTKGAAVVSRLVSGGAAEIKVRIYIYMCVFIFLNICIYMYMHLYIYI